MLMYAALIRAADRWRGLTVGKFEQRQLRAIREDSTGLMLNGCAPSCAPTRVRRPSDYPARPGLDRQATSGAPQAGDEPQAAGARVSHRLRSGAGGGVHW